MLNYLSISVFFIKNNRPSRNRTYIVNLEGLCPNPLDDRPLKVLGDTGFEPVTFCL